MYIGEILQEIRPGNKLRLTLMPEYRHPPFNVRCIDVAQRDSGRRVTFEATSHGKGPGKLVFDSQWEDGRDISAEFV